MGYKGNYYRCYRPVLPAPADAQPIAMVEFHSGGGGDGQPEVNLNILLNNLGARTLGARSRGNKKL